MEKNDGVIVKCQNQMEVEMCLALLEAMRSVTMTKTGWNAIYELKLQGETVLASVKCVTSVRQVRSES